MKPKPRTDAERFCQQRRQEKHEQLRQERLLRDAANSNSKDDEFTMLLELGNGMEKK